MNIYTEVTPNPATLKFVTEVTLLEGGAADFPTADSVGERSALAATLFKYPFTQGVMIGANFVTVTKTPEAKWEDVIPVVKTEMRTAIERGTVIDGGVDSSRTTADEGELEQRIRMLIDEQVRPAVAMDGGDIIYEGFDDGVVKLQLRGSCSGCPSSTVTLKMGIQSLLQRMVPEVKAVEAV
jgi:Fe-S cluster biogenesis protein NfuA